MPEDKRLLDVLLKEAAQRRVLKQGIKYDGRVYWHPDLATLVGEDITVRAAPSYTAPDEVEVYFEDQRQCTAFALDSAKGQALPRPVVSEAQRHQRANARRRITKAQNEEREAGKEVPSSESKRRHLGQRTVKLPDLPLIASPSTRSPDLFDFLVAEQARKDAPHDS